MEKSLANESGTLLSAHVKDSSFEKRFRLQLMALPGIRNVPENCFNQLDVTSFGPVGNLFRSRQLISTIF